MNRRDFLRHIGVTATSLALSPLASLSASEQKPPLDLGLGPQLFLDDYWIDRKDGLLRRVEQPERLAKPVLDSKTFGTTQPYLTVLRDPAAGHFRLWYNHGPAIWHAESVDG